MAAMVGTHQYMWHIEINPGQYEAFLANWKTWSEVMQGHPGARGVTIYRGSRGDIYVVIASWDTRAARAEASKVVRSIPWWTDNSQYGHVAVIGWLDAEAHTKGRTET